VSNVNGKIYAASLPFDLKNAGMIWVSTLNASRARQENTLLPLEKGVFVDRKGLHGSILSRKISLLGRFGGGAD
jgi:hypothetical protein